METENYRSINDTSHPDALRIERICQLRQDENRENVRRKKASLSAGGRHAVLTVAAASLALVAAAAVVWAVFFRKKDT